jgi:hypothetical protein
MTLRDRFSQAQTLAHFVAGPIANAEMWRTLVARHTQALLSGDIGPRAAAVSGAWHLLALVEDWCGDAFNTVPALCALTAAQPNIDLRVLRRDENLDLMDQHLSPTGGRAIPVVMVLDEHYIERGWWGSRPSALQTWMFSPEAQGMAKDDRYREARRWYTRDRGESTLSEVLAVIEAAGSTQRDSAGPNSSSTYG